MRLGESCDNKGRHIGMQNVRKNMRSVNMRVVLLHLLKFMMRLQCLKT